MRITKFILVGLLALVGIGFVSACSKQESSRQEKVELTKEEKQKIRKQEEKLALFLINNYENIKKIEFVSITQGGFGKSRTIEIKINGETTIHTDLQDSYKAGSTLGTFNSKEQLPKQKAVPSQIKEISDSDVEVKYYEEIELTAEEKQELRKEEDKIALYLINHYEGVKKIEFVRFHKGGFGTSDSISVVVNDNNYIKPIFLGGSNQDYSIAYNSERFRLVEKTPVTKIKRLDGVEIIYYEDRNS